MALTLLQMVQKAQAELGLPVAASVVGNTDATTTQMFALANRVLDELRSMNATSGWTALQFEYDLAVPVPLLTTGNFLTAFTKTISNIPSTAAIIANSTAISGANIPQGARVVTVNDATTVTMNMQSTNPAVATGANLTFAQDTFPEPPGFDTFQNRTMWDRTNHWELIGPTSPQMDQWHLSGIVTTGPRRHFRQVGPFTNNWRIWPPPFELVAPLQLVFEYRSNNAVNVLGTGINFAQYFANDLDTSLLNDQSIVTGIKWMFWEIKGMGSYITLQTRWVDYVNQLIGQDGAAPTLQLAKRQSPVFLSPSSVQDGFFPGPSGQSGI